MRALPKDLRFAQSVVEYLIRAGKDSAEAIESALNEVKPETGGIIMANAAQELMDRGFGLGEAKGYGLIAEQLFMFPFPASLGLRNAL